MGVIIFMQLYDLLNGHPRSNGGREFGLGANSLQPCSIPHDGAFEYKELSLLTCKLFLGDNLSQPQVGYKGGETNSQDIPFSTHHAM